jgi:hypothetical protein
MSVDIDFFIQITFVLMILSMINEKLVNFIKLQFPDNKFKRFLTPKVHLSKYAGAEEHLDAHKKKKVREIQTLSLLIGVALAITCRANLFQIYNPEFSWGWTELPQDYKFLWDGVTDVFGSLLTGAFLSLGSKFFHDLLGILLEVKQLKRKLKEGGGVDKLQTIEEIDNYVAEIEPLVIEKKLKEELSKNPKVQRFEYSEVDEAVDVFLMNADAEEIVGYQRFIEVELANKTIRSIEVNYISI